MTNLPLTLELPPLRVIDSYIESLREGFYRGIQAKKTDEEIQSIANDPQPYLDSLNAPIEGKLKTEDGTEFDPAPYETLWLVSDDIFIGEYSFRHALTPVLATFGGHVGYGIRPSLQGQGYATAGMELLKSRATDMGIDRLLVTCSPDNPASEKVIIKSGGIFENLETQTYGHGTVKRFWINL